MSETFLGELGTIVFTTVAHFHHQTEPVCFSGTLELSLLTFLKYFNIFASVTCNYY